MEAWQRGYELVCSLAQDGVLFVVVVFCCFFCEHNCTPSGKKRVTRVQAVTASNVQSTYGLQMIGHFILRITGDPITTKALRDRGRHTK